MYHCPECTTVLVAAAQTASGQATQRTLVLQTLTYDCPGCGQQFLQWVREYQTGESVDQWFHVTGSGKALLMHTPPEF
ncbi:MAG: hypothetical protein HY259_12060 [Chloroflexi bacterium]|nr:hypothetical protein [Chloroflexota bacterium]